MIDLFALGLKQRFGMILAYNFGLKFEIRSSFTFFLFPFPT